MGAFALRMKSFAKQNLSFDINSIEAEVFDFCPENGLKEGLVLYNYKTTRIHFPSLQIFQRITAKKQTKRA